MPSLRPARGDRFSEWSGGPGSRASERRRYFNGSHADPLFARAHQAAQPAAERMADLDGRRDSVPRPGGIDLLAVILARLPLLDSSHSGSDYYLEIR